MSRTALPAALFLALGLGIAGAQNDPPSAFLVCVSNERSDDVTIIDGTSRKVLGTVPVGKRPRGIHASPDGGTLYVALSGTPIGGPPKLDAKGNPIFEEKDDDGDRSADGIAVVDLRSKKLLRRLPAGSDPEE